MTVKYVCIHAHFYQPPRENPWLEEVEQELSAAPFHNWNSRITRECYAANAMARILKGGKLYRITNSLSKISWNFGPTLLSWMERHEPETYRHIQEADKASMAAFGGHGNGIAQCFNHSIMPLHSKRDKETQIVWGIRDFEKRFGRKPEGIWLPETAVGGETLSLAAKHGIKFTILAPNQASKVKQNGQWVAASGKLDTTRPYIFRPPEGGEIAIFFYDGDISHEIAFNGALRDGVKMGNDLMKPLLHHDYHLPQLSHIATDGESYGHHHKFGEMALASAISTVEAEEQIKLINYGYFLEKFPPTEEVEVAEKSSWSCAHGVERWRADCGCEVGGEQGWNQRWRAPLRDALDRLKEQLDELFEKKGSRYFSSPWGARNGYIDLMLEGVDAGLEKFGKTYFCKELSSEEIVEALELLEMQAASMKMYTSCGWFFSELAGLEGRQILRYAAYAIELATGFGLDAEPQFIGDLAKASSNMPEIGDGARLYKEHIKPVAEYPKRVVAHLAMLSHMHDGKMDEDIYCYKVELKNARLTEHKREKLYSGELELTNKTTLRTMRFGFALLDDKSVGYHCQVLPEGGAANWGKIEAELIRIMSDIEPLRALLAQVVGGTSFDVSAIFEGQRQDVVTTITESITTDVHSHYKNIYSKHQSSLWQLRELNMPVPQEFLAAVKYVLEEQLGDVFADGNGVERLERLEHIFLKANRWKVRLGYGHMMKIVMKSLENYMGNICSDEASMAKLIALITLLKKQNVQLDEWKIQNLLYPAYKAYRDKANEQHSFYQRCAGMKELLELFGFCL